MKFKLLALTFVFSALFLISAVNSDLKKPNTFAPIAVIELFTSQGCSSCPKADYLLNKTISSAVQKNRNIFALSFHVDYWNYLGWKDPFSSKQFSDRQSEYINKLHLRSGYTPQMIVNGTKEFVGSNENALENAIKESLILKSEVEFKTLNASFGDKKELKVSYELIGDLNNCKINLALISLSETTHIKSGENAGVTLTNQNTVKQFVSIKATEKGEVEFDSSSLPAIGNRAIIAYLQNTQSFKIIGASQLKLN